MRLRNKSVLWLLSLALLMSLTGCQRTGTPYHLTVSREQVTQSVLYRSDGDQPWEKLALLGEEISAAMEALSGIQDWGDYGAQGVPAGGVTYVLVFRLSDGTQWACAYCDSGAQKGYFSDGDAKILVTGCGLTALWETLASRAEPVKAEEELINMPQL